MACVIKHRLFLFTNVQPYFHTASNLVFRRVVMGCYGQIPVDNPAKMEWDSPLDIGRRILSNDMTRRTRASLPLNPVGGKNGLFLSKTRVLASAIGTLMLANRNGTTMGKLQ